jgi:cobalamin biosynthesis protein CobT
MIRITRSFPSSPLPFQDPIKKIQKQLYDSIEQFKTKLQSLSSNPSKAKDPQFLEEFAYATQQLHSSIEETEKSSLDGHKKTLEDLKDAADIMNNILYQSLDVQGAPDISLLKAASDFQKETSTASGLSLVLHNFTKYEAPLQRLIEEISLVMEDLEN